MIGGAVGTTVVLLSRGPKSEPPAWSRWQPTGDDTVRIQQIAEHVGKKYRLSDGRQLDAVIASHPRVQNLPIAAIAIKPRQTDVNQGIAVTRADRSWAFNLCGLAKDCSIEAGTPGEPRGRLLRREALELALYTFKYVPSSETVVTFLPPAGGNTLYALFFDKDSLRRQLTRPLRMTIPVESATATEENPGAPPETIDRLTVPHIYKYGIRQAPDGNAVLVLDPLAIGG
ncbi:MAG TPA: hypothetical protein VF101_09030 [Gaiellaceae bacterium]